MKINITNKLICWICGFTAIIIFIGLFGLDKIIITNTDWIEKTGYLDFTQHYSAWVAYREAPWTFPLGYCQNLLYPTGKTITFADAIPLAAILFKFIGQFLSANIQYFGLYIALCFFLQGFVSAKILLLLTDKKIVIFLLSILYILFPPLLTRSMDHCALSSQWIILISIYLYITSMRKHKCSPFFVLLLCISIGIHPYFVPFVLFFVMSFIISSFFNHNKKEAFNGIFIMLASIISALITGWIIGAFYGNQYSAISDVGWRWGDLINTVNLNSWFNPHNSNGDWSFFIMPFPELGSQTGGFNYLGLGNLLLLLFIIFSLLQRTLKYNFIHRHSGLIVCSIFFAFYGISNTVTLNDMILFSIPIPDKLRELFSVFRAGGRFFWVLDLLLITFLCNSMVKRIKNRKIIIAAAFIFSMIQMVDLSPMIVKKHNFWYSLKENNYSVLKSEYWDYLSNHYSRLVSIKRYHNLNALASWGYRNNMQVSINALARGIRPEQEAYNKQMDKDILDRKFQAETVYFIGDMELFYELAFECKDIYAALVDDWYPIVVLKNDDFPESFSGAVCYSRENLRTIKIYADSQNIYHSGVSKEEKFIMLPSTEYTLNLVKEGKFISLPDTQPDLRIPIKKVEKTTYGIKVFLDISSEEIEQFHFTNRLEIIK